MQRLRLYDSSSYIDMLKEGKQELFINEYSWSNADIIDWFLLSTGSPILTIQDGLMRRPMK